MLRFRLCWNKLADFEQAVFHPDRNSKERAPEIRRKVLWQSLELVSKLLSAAIGCKACGAALSAKRVLDVLQHASEPFPPPALPTDFSLDFAKKSVLKPVLAHSTPVPQYSGS
jgi:hypothetical protein